MPQENVSNAVAEKREQFTAKQKQLGEVFEAAGPDIDFSRKAVLDKLGAADSSDAVAKVKSLNVELDVIGAQLERAELEEVKGAIGERERARSLPVRHGVPHPAGEIKEKSFGDLVIESKSYTDGYLKGRQPVSMLVDIDIKTLFASSAGFAPQSVRSGLIVPAATRPVQILDLIPSHPITQAVDKYMLETTHTAAAAETTEGNTYNESTFVFTEETSTVRKITDSIPVTDEQLEDAPEVAALLNQRLSFGLRQRLDGQVFNGDGNAPNLTGLLIVSAIGSQAKGVDPVFDAVLKAMQQVRITGRAYPSAIIMHPTDWTNVRLTRTADGLYIMGNPSDPGPMALFGLPVAQCDAGSAGTALVADLINFSYIAERRGIEVEVGYTGTQFTEGKKTLRASVRCAFTVTRPTSICKITGL